MPYSLDPSLPLNEALKRAAREQLVAAVSALRSGDRADDLAIHEARKSLKKVRGILRLVIDEIGREQFGENNFVFGELSRRLSSARDRAVILSAFEQYCAPCLEIDACERIRGRLLEHTIRQSPSDVRRKREVVADAIERELARVDAWPLDRPDFRAINGGLKRAYVKVRNAYATVLSEASDETLHEWRKRTKTVWYHARLLQPKIDGVGRAMVLELGELGDLLGRERDLSLVAATLVIELEPGDPALDTLTAHIQNVRVELLARATALGARLFQHRAKDHVNNLRTAWYHAAAVVETQP